MYVYLNPSHGSLHGRYWWHHVECAPSPKGADSRTTASISFLRDRRDLPPVTPGSDAHRVLMVRKSVTVTEKDRERDRQTDRQRETEKARDRERQTEKERERERV